MSADLTRTPAKNGDVMNKHDRPMGSLERRIRAAESDLFAVLDAGVEERFLDLKRTDLRVRLLSHGSGPPLLLLHGGISMAAAWAPLFAELQGFRLLAVDLPGHGLSDPVRYRRGRVREHTHRLLDDVVDALELDDVPVVGHSLGSMFALWHVAAGSKRISAVIAVGAPAVALPGTRVRMPLSPLTVRGLGVAVLRSPSPRRIHRSMLAQGVGSAEVQMAPDSLLEALRLSMRRPENARSVASLLRAIDRFRRPRPESVLTAEELAAIRVPTTFILGTDDPYLSPRDARPSIAQIPNATVHEMPAGHGPWLVDPGRVAGLIAAHQQTAGEHNPAHLGAKAARS
jgi:pimeloyl-ACP methyl ester carboxylesterase